MHGWHLRRAINYMALYIWSAQPAVRDKYVVYENGAWKPNVHCPTRILRSEEPENPGYHGWEGSLKHLFLAFPDIEAEQMRKVVTAVALAAIAQLRLKGELESFPEIIPKRLQPLLGPLRAPNID